MKLAEFNALCDREWSKPKRGDVITLTLTEAGHEELHRDMLMNPQQFGPLLFLCEKDVKDIRAGGRFRQIVNPITRGVVEIRTRKGGSRETARVRVMGGTCRSTWWAADPQNR